MRELQSRRRVKTLRRKHALPLAVLKPRPLAQQLCTQWHTAAPTTGNIPPSCFTGEPPPTATRSLTPLIRTPGLPEPSRQSPNPENPDSDNAPNPTTRPSPPMGEIGGKWE